jgi:hypothetical protein
MKIKYMFGSILNVLILPLVTIPINYRKMTNKKNNNNLVEVITWNRN